MNTPRTAIAPLLGLLLVTGCIDRSRNDAVINGIGKLQLVDLPGITLRTTGEELASSPLMTALDLFGELEAADGVQLPTDLADSVAQQIRNYLQQAGCNVTGGGSGSGGYTEASGVKNANIQGASISFDLNRSGGQVDVFVVERDHQFLKKHVVGQLIVLVRVAR